MSTTTRELAAGGKAASEAACPDMNEIFDLFPLPTLVVSPSNQIQKVSRGLLEVWGRGEGEFVGNDLFAALYANSPTERFDRISLAYAIERARAGRKPHLCHAAYASNRHTLWSARVVPIHRNAELLCLVLEWERVQMQVNYVEGELTNSWLSVDEAFRILVQGVKDYAIFLLDTRGNVATWNIGAELLKGYKREEIIGKHFSIFYGQDDLRAGKPERKLETCLREGRVEDKGWRYRKDGSRFWASVVITAVYRNGVHVGFGKVTRDLTEWKQAENRLIEANEESTKLKNDFLANMSHEIRTPMHGMLSACSLLLDTSLTPKQRETAGIIEESGQILRQVINDILDYSKLASGGFSVNADTVGVADIMTSVARSVQTTLQPGVSLRLDLAPDLPKAAQGDPLRFRQIVQNIVGNAAKFTDKGSITLRSSLIFEDDVTYTILAEVSDTGPGVSGEDAEHLFKPFTQVDATATKRFKGTGLGLSIAKSLAELMGGEIGYRPNEHGKGSVFWFTAKLKKANDGKGDGRADPSPGAERQPALGSEEAKELVSRLKEVAPTKRILAAEDNLINQKVLSGILNSFGFKDITLVSDGAQAVSKIAGSSQVYDLVLMDISMPVMDGFQATVEIKKAPGKHPPIVAMTAHALKGDREQCLSLGMDDYVPKPVNRLLLATKLLKWLAPGYRGREAVENAVNNDLREPTNPLPLQINEGRT
ncbi:related to histidine kinase tcsA protein [Cephalotrichum gorgonifer]|uniref:Related to histidine kinase tcsA protein n=1 Tax=Cephalotrichum gorgonifer TaxID=2041049 RepID=A0AAE8N0R5_9PEZI|nr:related to histidine kinase tcsA protein [Cephalotrichum gorgonifer]